MITTLVPIDGTDIELRSGYKGTLDKDRSQNLQEVFKDSGPLFTEYLL